MGIAFSTPKNTTQYSYGIYKQQSNMKAIFTWQRPSRAPTADLHLVVMSARRFTSARLSAVRDDSDELLLSSTRARVCTSPLRSCGVGGWVVA